jgi:hypothetical protein
VAFLGIPLLSVTRIVRAIAVVLLLGWTAACSISGEPPRERIESALPDLNQHIARYDVVGPAANLSPDEVLRIAMASCVRYHCPPESSPGRDAVSGADGVIVDRNSLMAILEFQSPRNVPTTLPLPGWFGPIRGYEEMTQVRQLSVALRPGVWADVIARHSDSTRTCWKSNWKTQLP